MALPNATPHPCNGCPWRRVSAPGWLGPFDAMEWVQLASSDEPIACHETIREEEDWSDPDVKQCRGAAIYRANIAKLPRNPQVTIGPVDRESVFSSPPEFIQHHNIELRKSSRLPGAS